MDPPLINGTWVKYSLSDNDISDIIVDDDPNKLKDPECKDEPQDLVLDEIKLHQSGVMLVCSKQDLDHLIFTSNSVIIKKSNTCSLLCNFRYTLTLENSLMDDGKAKWVVKRPKSTDEEAIVKEDGRQTNIYCW